MTINREVDWSSPFVEWVDWRSRKQKSTAQSPTDAEYSALEVGLCETHTDLTSLEWAWQSQLSLMCSRLTVTDFQHQETESTVELQLNTL